MKTLLLLITFIICVRANAQIVVATGGSAPHASNMLDIKSTIRSALLPQTAYNDRIAIGSPATGLMVYQTNNK